MQWLPDDLWWLGVAADSEWKQAASAAGKATVGWCRLVRGENKISIYEVTCTLWDWLISGSSASGRVTLLSVCLEELKHWTVDTVEEIRFVD